MRQFLAGLSVSFAFILGCVAATAMQSTATPTASAGPPPAAVEYACHSPGVHNDQSRSELLNRYAAEGWELAAFWGDTHACFKRAR